MNIVTFKVYCYGCVLYLDADCDKKLHESVMLVKNWSSKMQGITCGKVAAKVEQLNNDNTKVVANKPSRESFYIPHSMYTDEIDLTKLVKLQEDLKDYALECGTKQTLMPFFIKAVSIALNEAKRLNATIDPKTESITLKLEHNIGVAIDTARGGRVIPNIKNCQNKSVSQLAVDLHDLIERGSKDKLGPEDFADGTFTLSNTEIVRTVISITYRNCM